jgi:hypothetical protein
MRFSPARAPQKSGVAIASNSPSAVVEQTGVGCDAVAFPDDEHVVAIR